MSPQERVWLASSLWECLPDPDQEAVEDAADAALARARQRGRRIEARDGLLIAHPEVMRRPR